MKASRFTDGQILAILKKESGISVPNLCREHGMSSASFYRWRANRSRDTSIREKSRVDSKTTLLDCFVAGAVGFRPALNC